ncbi:membrane protein [Robbsia andropogonis]|uniref:UPF0114 protein WM40_15455 n=1 Tax=Robbsia andropogonis TaxID=28092 RepID=A0A0F5JYL9_9BURK|nr:TIGR00645 family protein [Robbsia andropogonis]KKB62704.1 membrane protein [Robbsia andropogonis]MCP1119744.1 TIGR00645 family protein [Robbsia andropogonis]MCP1129727.1 TIGR00645 family protein [Robbsia andropogonis]
MNTKQKTTGQPNHPLEYAIERGLFASRWILAPIYVGLALSMLLLLFKFAQECWHMVSHMISMTVDDTILGLLSLIDLSLMGNLMLMIMFGGYQNFVSKLDLEGHKDTPDWVAHVGFSDLKLKLMASIVAISAIELLKNFMSIEHVSTRTLAWGIGIHMAFVVSAVLLAGMDVLMTRVRDQKIEQDDAL